MRIWSNGDNELQKLVFDLCSWARLHWSRPNCCFLCFQEMVTEWKKTMVASLWVGIHAHSLHSQPGNVHDLISLTAVFFTAVLLWLQYYPPKQNHEWTNLHIVHTPWPRMELSSKRDVQPTNHLFFSMDKNGGQINKTTSHCSPHSFSSFLNCMDIASNSYEITHLIVCTCHSCHPSQI